MKIGLGQDSHRFDFDNNDKPLILGGVIVEGYAPLKGNSDADVVYHALTNAISGITCYNVIGPVADKMCFEQDIQDSAEYVREALKYLNGMKVSNVSLSIECAAPKIIPIIPAMRESISRLLGIEPNCVGITATSGEKLTPFGKGEGIQVICTVLAE